VGVNFLRDPEEQDQGWYYSRESTAFLRLALKSVCASPLISAPPSPRWFWPELLSCVHFPQLLKLFVFCVVLSLISSSWIWEGRKV